MIRSLLIFVVSLCVNATFLHAQTHPHTSVVGKLAPSSTNYYSAMDGHFTLSYINDSIPSESVVYLRHGFQKSEFYQGKLYPSSSWNDLQLLAMKPMANASWQTTIVKQLYSRGSSSQLTAIDFVFEIHLPNGKVLFEKGSNSNLGYFNASFPVYTDPCNIESSPGCELNVIQVIKD